MYHVLLSVVPEASGGAVFSMMEGLEDRDVESFVMLVSSLQRHMPQGQFDIARRTLEGLLAALRTFLKERETAMGDDYCSESPTFKPTAIFATLLTAIESLLPTSNEQRDQAQVAVGKVLGLHAQAEVEAKVEAEAVSEAEAEAEAEADADAEEPVQVLVQAQTQPEVGAQVQTQANPASKNKKKGKKKKSGGKKKKGSKH
jgi:hypothetical protein